MKTFFSIRVHPNETRLCMRGGMTAPQNNNNAMPGGTGNYREAAAGHMLAGRTASSLHPPTKLYVAAHHALGTMGYQVNNQNVIGGQQGGGLNVGSGMSMGGASGSSGFNSMMNMFNAPPMNQGANGNGMDGLQNGMNRYSRGRPPETRSITEGVLAQDNPLIRGPQNADGQYTGAAYAAMVAYGNPGTRQRGLDLLRKLLHSNPEIEGQPIMMGAREPRTPEGRFVYRVFLAANGDADITQNQADPDSHLVRMVRTGARRGGAPGAAAPEEPPPAHEEVHKQVEAFNKEVVNGPTAAATRVGATEDYDVSFTMRRPESRERLTKQAGAVPAGVPRLVEGAPGTFSARMNRAQMQRAMNHFRREAATAPVAAPVEGPPANHDELMKRVEAFNKNPGTLVTSILVVMTDTEVARYTVRCIGDITREGWETIRKRMNALNLAEPAVYDPDQGQVTGATLSDAWRVMQALRTPAR